MIKGIKCFFLKSVLWGIFFEKYYSICLYSEQVTTCKPIAQHSPSCHFRLSKYIAFHVGPVLDLNYVMLISDYFLGSIHNDMQHAVIKGR